MSKDLARFNACAYFSMSFSRLTTNGLKSILINIEQVKYKKLVHCHCGTNNRAIEDIHGPLQTRGAKSAREESASPAWLAAPATDARNTTKV